MSARIKRRGSARAEPEGSSAAVISNPVVEQALESLTLLIGWDTGRADIGDTWDRAMAGYHFRILYDGRERYEPQEIVTWAASHRWSAEAARELGEIAGAARDRGWRLRRVVVRDAVLEQWRASASESPRGGREQSTSEQEPATADSVESEPMAAELRDALIERPGSAPASFEAAPIVPAPRGPLERRSGIDRRSGEDRRRAVPQGLAGRILRATERRVGAERRGGPDRRQLVG